MPANSDTTKGAFWRLGAALADVAHALVENVQSRLELRRAVRAAARAAKKRNARG